MVFNMREKNYEYLDNFKFLQSFEEIPNLKKTRDFKFIYEFKIKLILKNLTNFQCYETNLTQTIRISIPLNLINY